MRIESDGVEKVTGKAVYTSDIRLPGMAYARILGVRSRTQDRSKSTRRKRSNSRRHRDLESDDIQGFNYKYGATYKDQSIVAVDKVRYVGDPVAAVLADDPASPSRHSKTGTKYRAYHVLLCPLGDCRIIGQHGGDGIADVANLVHRDNRLIFVGGAIFVVEVFDVVASQGGNDAGQLLRFGRIDFDQSCGTGLLRMRA